jgi:hypothetical protein
MFVLRALRQIRLSRSHDGFEAVIASEAKQSISPREGRMDCFAEPVIARIRATRWLAMTLM